MQTHSQWSRFTLLKQKITGTLSTLLMISWAIFLSLYTFEIQHSCEPLVGASICTPCTEVITPQHFWQRIDFLVKEESLPLCLEKGNDSKPAANPDTPDALEKNNSKTNGDSNRKVEPKSPIIGPEKLIEGSVVGSIVAVGAVVAGAPAIVAIGVGVAVWLAASALLPS